ncbi:MULTISPECIES: hypothetical protein [Flavobacterium]|nr:MULTISPECIES: hypothetical protein [Flavobacterium]MRX38402.1 hypothetical protein [Flavobacterium sp. LC2016-23]SHM81099.1 hypothetical protein SAMN05444387_3259 [Flavobacterium pectinovorum]
MKFQIIDENNLGNKRFVVKIQLLPENMTEANSIRNIEAGTADDNERVTVTNFLHFVLSQKNYSPIGSLDQQGEIFTISAFKN